MKKVIATLALTFATLTGAAAADYTSYNCEFFVDKVVPIKVYFHNQNTTYNKLEMFLKVDPNKFSLSQVEGVYFHAKPTVNHAYGVWAKEWKTTKLEKIANDYYKASLETRAQNHYATKYSYSTSYTGNFYVQLKNGNRIWTAPDQGFGRDFHISDVLVNNLPLNFIWLNDGSYNIDSIPQIADFEGQIQALNPKLCK